MKSKAYDIVVKELIEMIKSTKVLPWTKPWSCKNGEIIPINHHTKKPYQGSNIFMLNYVRMMKGYVYNRWAGYGQWKKEGLQVKKGESSTKILLPVFKEDLTNINVNTGEPEKILVNFQYVSIFNIEQTDAIIESDEPNEDFQSHEEAEKIIEMYEDKPPIAYIELDRAYYNPLEDKIVLPPRSTFHDMSGFYSTAFHELVHSTGHKKRLGRLTKENEKLTRSSEDYSYEELVAELGACFLLSKSGILENHRKSNSAGYLKNWLEVLEDNPSWLMKASTDAVKAVQYMENQSK